MQWIEEVIWAGGGYSLKVSSQEGVRSEISINKLADVIQVQETENLKIRGGTDFKEWRSLDSQEVAELRSTLGFSDGPTGQEFFEFSDEDRRFVIPAAVLMCGVFRPFHGISRYLFSPQGLENLCIPDLNVATPELLFFVSARGATGMQPDKAAGILNSLSWLHCFPSAKAMWDSLLVNARTGRLTTILPTGSFSFYGRGIRVAEKLLITQLNLRLLETTESPYPCFSNHTRAIEFERVLHKANQEAGHKHLPTKVTSLPSRHGVYTLSDDEWSAVSLAMDKPATGRRYHPLRTVIDAILHKLGTGLTWEEASPVQLDNTLARKTFARMRKNGRWEMLLDLLQRHRTSAPKNDIDIEIDAIIKKRCRKRIPPAHTAPTVAATVH